MGATCCANSADEERGVEINHHHDPNKQPPKGALSKKSNDEKKFVKFPTKVRQDDDEKKGEQSEMQVEDDNYLESENPQDIQSKSNKKSMFSKQKSQFVKHNEDD